MTPGNELIAASLGAVLGAILGSIGTFLLDIRKERDERRRLEAEEIRERRQLRASIATALIQDLRSLETTLRQFAAAEKPGLWVGRRPSLAFDALRGETRHLAPDTLPRITEFFRLADSVFTVIEEAPPPQRSDPHFNHFLRTSSIFALQALAPAKDALVREGGCIPDPRVLEVIDFPNLPALPARAFPDVAAPGQVLPDEIA